MSAMQARLVKVTKLKPDKADDRQVFLYDVAVFISEMDGDKYDKLADDNQDIIDWYESAAAAIQGKVSIPDFPDVVADETDTEPQDPPEPTEQEIVREKVTKRYRELTGEKDKWGGIKGTKSSDAMYMIEKGCTMKAVADALGGTHYNQLKRLVKEGHKLEKLEGNVWKLTHRDE